MAQPSPGGDWEVTQFTTRQGLPQNWVTSMVQTRDGHVWLGTHGGLARFDGAHFQVFNVVSTPELQSNRISALLEASNGDLWIGTSYDGVVRLRDKRFESLRDLPGSPFGEIRSIQEDVDGNIWFAAPQLVRFRDGMFTPAEFAHPDETARGFRKLHQDSKGTLWAASSSGLARLSAGRWSYLNAAPELASVIYVGESSLGVWAAGNRWFAHVRDDTLVRVRVQGRPAGEIRASLIDRQGTAWIGAGGRLLTLQEELGADGVPEVSFTPAPHGSPAADFETRAGVRALLEDHEGNLWVSMNGLMRLRRQPHVAVPVPPGNRSAWITRVESEVGGTAWLAARVNAAGSALLENGADGWVEREDWGSRPIQVMVPARRGGVWIASTDRLILHLDGRQLEEFEHDLGRVHCLEEDAQGVLWVYTATGLASLHEGVFTRRPLGDAPAWTRQRPAKMHTSASGNVLVLWRNGVMRRAPDGQTTFSISETGLPEAEPRSLYETPDGAVWISTYGAGLVRWLDGQFVTISTRDGLPDSNLGEILADREGHLWINSNMGVLRVLVDDLNAFADGRTQRVPARLVTRSEGDGAMGGELSSGQLWFRTINTMVLIDPDAVEARRAPPQLSIERVSADEQVLDHRRPIRVRTGEGHLEIDFAVLSFTSPDLVRVRYILEGHDPDWVDASDLRTARYAHVPPGEYTFRLSACNDDGAWGDATATLDFEFVPHVWQTTWFAAFALSLLAALGLLAHQHRTRRIRATNAALLSEIDSRMRLEAAHREQKARLQVALSSAEMGTWRWDPVQNLSTLDAGMSRMLGLGDRETTIPTSEYVAMFHPDDRVRACAIFDRAVAERVDMLREFRMVRSDGETRWYRERGRPHYDSAGGLAYLTGASVDITQRKQAEEERRQLEESLRHRHKMEAIGQLASGVAHEFNNLLVGILCNAELLLESEEANLDDVSRKRLQDIDRCGERAATLTHKLLSFAKRDTTRRTVFDLNDLVTEAVPMLDGIVGERIELKVDLTSDLPPVESDRGHVEQGLLNLVLNARDALPDGGQVTIRTSTVTIDGAAASRNPDAREGDHALLTVSDNGCGMTPQTLGRIFEPFFTTKPTGKGTGLGLSTLFANISNAGGHVEVNSEEGVGSIFRVFLPLGIADPSAPQPSVTRGAAKAASGDETILVCDDEGAVLSAVASVLEKEGYDVLMALGAVQARVLAKEHEGSIDLLLVDVVMPDANGPELAQELLRERPDLRVMYMSGYPADVLRAEGQEFEFLKKPPTRAALLRRVREVLGRAPQG